LLKPFKSQRVANTKYHTMKLSDFPQSKTTTVVVEQQLDEINMSPTSLRQLAGAITGAQAGMEFEMIVPGVGDPDGGEQEPDYDQDESVRGIQDAADFFHDGDFNGRREIERLKERMYSDYQDWLFSEFENRWDGDQDEFVYEYVRNNLNESEIAEVLGLSEEEAEALSNRGANKDDYRAAAAKIVADSVEPYYDDAREDAESDFVNDSDHEEEWLSHEGIEAMSDVANNYDIQWPHWTSAGGGEGDIDQTADDFSRMIGKPVNASNSYHGARREAGKYVVEPDGSLEADDDNDTGLEFVSPPMPIVELLSDLDKVVKWAGSTGCYTNDSTGLHINVSVPGTEKSENIDYVKLALLLGDNYILEQFGRAGNTYCKSGMAIIKERVMQRPEDAQALLTKMRNGLDAMASKLIHSGNTQKFTSINMKDGYVEFRSPGGDWLEEYASGKGTIENALLRFVVALDAAVKPELYKQEYLKKLYAMLQPKSQNDTLAYFAKFAAGELPKAALKSFVRQAQLERQGKKAAEPATSSVPASSTGNWGIWIGASERFARQPGEYPAGQEIPIRRFPSQAAAEQFLAQTRTENPRMRSDVEVREIEPSTPVPGSTLALQQQRAAQAQAGSMPTQTWTGQWLVKDAATGRELHKFGGIGNNQGDANRIAAQWARDNNRGGEIDVVPEYQ
jgi:hypothetical protein